VAAWRYSGETGGESAASGRLEAEPSAVPVEACREEVLEVGGLVSLPACPLHLLPVEENLGEVTCLPPGAFWELPVLQACFTCLGRARLI